MTAAGHGRDTAMRLAILGATGGIGGHLLTGFSFIHQTPAICW
jgi:hypothetical protein